MPSDKEHTRFRNASILHELENRVKEHPDKLLYAFLDIQGNIKESYTYKEFYQRLNGIAAQVHSSQKFNPGDRILLAYPPGLEMICAFFSCIRLGLIPVPVYPPSAQGFEASVSKMSYIAADCGAKAALTTSSYYWSIKVNLSRSNGQGAVLKELEWMVSDEAGSAEYPDLPDLHSDILFLQYTSGSTSEPKGVMVTHANMLHNCNSVVDHLPIGVSWLPQYHDMGLIGYYIFFALKGGTTYGFSPTDFIQRPALWLESISRFKATASSAPNFAFEYCLAPGKIPDKTYETLDLGSLRFLMTAAEPVNPAVYTRFLEKFTHYGLNPKSFFAAYGLAEFTLAVSNYGRTITAFDAQLLAEHKVSAAGLKKDEHSTIRLMSCGIPLGDTQIKIVDPASNCETSGCVGEIWVRGSSKGAGYWNKAALSKQTFEAQSEQQPDSAAWLRTGDLGFMHDGELYVCGRIKDMIIIRGLNYYPQDIESIIEEDPLVRKGCVAAFAVEKNGKESLVAVIGMKNNKRIPDAQALNNKLIKHLGIGAEELLFIPARTISKTSSGKIMRRQNKDRYLQNGHQVISRACFSGEELTHPESEAAKRAKIKPELNGSDLHTLFNRYGLTGKEHAALGHAGLDSIRLAEFAHDLKAYVSLQGYADLSHEIDLRLLQKIAVSELTEILEGLRDSSALSAFRFKRAFTRLHQEHE